MLRKNIYLCSILLFAVAGFHMAIAQEYTVSHLAGAKGPTCPQVNYIYMDSDSLIWLGTGNTVERYDGSNYLVYSFKEQTKDRGENIVNSLVKTHKNKYWAGNPKGLWLLNHQTMTVDRMYADKINCSVNALDKDRQENLYIGTANGLYIKEGDVLKHVSLDKWKAEDNLIIDVHVCNETGIWLLTPNEIVFYNKNTAAMSKHPCPLETKYGKMTCFTHVGDSLYVGTERNGVIVFDLNKFIYGDYIQEWESAVTCLSYNGHGILGVGTDNDGICLVSLKDKKMTFRVGYDAGEGNGLGTNLISSLLVCGNNIWAGTKFYIGWYRITLNDNLITLYQSGDFSTKDITLRSFMRTSNHTFWGTRDGLLVWSEKDGKLYRYTSSAEGGGILRSNLIFSFYEYQGKCLVGTYRGGACIFDTESMRLRPFDTSGLTDNNDVFMFLADGQGDLWMATLGGLYHYGKDLKLKKGYIPANSDLPGEIIYTIKIDSKQRFWVGTDKGLVLFDRNKESFSIPPQAGSMLKNTMIEYIYEDGDGRLFFVGTDGKLFCMDSNLSECRRLLEGLDMAIENIIQDNLGNYWIGTDKGLIHSDASFGAFTNYSSTPQISSLALTSGTPPVKDQDGKIWMANFKGLVVIDPKIPPHVAAMQVYRISASGVTYADISTTDIDHDTPVRIAGGGDNIAFSLSSKGCSDITSIPLEYMLEGYDTIWSASQGKTEISYFNIPPGEYVFKVRKKLNDASMSTVPIVVVGKGKAWMWIILFVVMLPLVFYAARIWTKRKVDLPSVEEKVNETVSNDTSTKQMKIRDEEAEAIVCRIKEYMEKDKPYLNLDLKQSDMAIATGYSTQLLSQVFNQYLKTGYYDFVNTYRVEEFKRLVQDGRYEKYTLVTMAKMCGFKSQTSFFRTFKKITGLTPNEYIHQMGK